MNNRAPKLPSEQPSPQVDEALSVAFLQFDDSVMSYHVLLCISCASLQAVSYQLSGVYWDFKHFFLSRSLITFPNG